MHDDVFLLVLNAHHEPISFTVPGIPTDPVWWPVLDTAQGENLDGAVYRSGDAYPVQGRSLVLLQQQILADAAVLHDTNLAESA